jgi:2'-5' RNA ligase
MSEEKFIGLNIAFRIPDDVAKVAMELSREITEKEDAYFVLDGVDYFPHITNYAMEISEKNVDAITWAMEELSGELSPVEFVFEKNKADEGWVAPYFVYTDQLKEVHGKCVEKLNLFREDHVREKFKNSDKFSSKEEKENVAKYGHPWVLEQYNPHLTITKLKDDVVAEKVAKEMDWSVEKFRSDTIGIFVSGEHGTCRKLVKEFKLGK